MTTMRDVRFGLFFLLSTTLWVGCGGAPSVVEPPESPVMMSWNLAVGLERFHVVQELSTRLERGEDVLTATSERIELATSLELLGTDQVNLGVEAARGRVEDDLARTTFLFDTEHLPSDAEPTTARTMRRLLTATTQLLFEAKGPSQAPPWGGIRGPIWDVLSVLPEASLMAGGTWTTVQSFDEPQVGRIERTRILTLVGQRVDQSLPCTEVQFQSTYRQLMPVPDATITSYSDEGRLCFGRDGRPLSHTLRVSQQVKTSTGLSTVSLLQTTLRVPPKGEIPWELRVPTENQAAPKATVKSTNFGPDGPNLPPPVVRRLGSARFNYPQRIYAVEPAPAAAQFAVASGNQVSIVDAATGARTAVLVADCAPLVDLAWDADGTRMIGVCEGEVTKAVIWRIEAPEAPRILKLPAQARWVATGHYKGEMTAWFGGSDNEIVRLPLQGQAKPVQLPLVWPTPPPPDLDPEGEDAEGSVQPIEDPSVTQAIPPRISRLRVAPDGHRGVAVADGRPIRVDLETGKIKLLADAETVVHAVRWLPGRDDVFVMAVNDKLQLWRIDEPAMIPGAEVALEGRVWEGAESLSISADGRFILAWQLVQGASLWRIDGDQISRVQVDLKSGELAVLASDGRYVASRSIFSRVLSLFDIEGSEGIAGAGHQVPIVDMSITTDGRSVATADQSGAIFLWSAEDGELVRKVQFQGRRKRYGRTYDMFVSWLKPGRLLVGDPSGGGVLRADRGRARLFKEGWWWIERVLGDRNGRRALTIQHGRGAVTAWTVRHREPEALWQAKGPKGAVYTHEATVCGAGIAADGRRAALVWSDGRVEVREVDSGAVLFEGTGQGEVCQVALSADGSLLAVVGPKRDEVTVSQVDTGKARVVLERVSGWYDRFGPLVFDPTGRYLAAGLDAEILQYDLQAPADRGWLSPTQQLHSPDGPITRLAYLGRTHVISTSLGSTSALIWAWPK